MSCAPWNPAGCAADIAKSVAGDAFSTIAHDFAKAADSATNWLWDQMGAATAVHLGGSGFNLDVGIVLAITATVAVGLFLIQVIGATLRRDSGGLARAARGLVVAFIGGGLAVGVTNVLLAAIDSLSNGVVLAATGRSISGMGQSILGRGAIGETTTNPAALMLLSLATLAAVMIVWAALMVRKVLIVVSAVFAPLAFAGSLSDITLSWTKRWIETIVALIISKLILVLIFVVGLGMLVDGVGQAGKGDTQVVTQTISGVLVLALAGFAPWLALKLVHFSGDQFHHLHAMASTAAAGAQRAAQAPQKVASVGSMAGIGAPVAAGAGVTAAAVRTPAVATSWSSQQASNQTNGTQDKTAPTHVTQRAGGQPQSDQGAPHQVKEPAPAASTPRSRPDPRQSGGPAR